MLAIRLRRMGNRNSPFYRVVVSDSRRVPRSSAIEELGHYHPSGTLKGVDIDLERLNYWVDRGAKPSPTVLRLVKQQAKGGLAQTEAVETPAAEAVTAEEPTAEAQAAAAETEADSSTEAETGESEAVETETETETEAEGS
ncbi:MAG: 30S ribosomal protein S16 [Thermoanaerobaculia bacterium]|nr:30S ribosomal protein S16 [Thermoanaerobaculia bacterium]